MERLKVNKLKLKSNIISKLIFLIICQTAICQSDEDITSYWNTLTKEQRIEQIRRLYQIENAIPTISNINILAVISNKDLYISYPDNINIKISDLEYSVKFPDIKIPDFFSNENIRPLLTVIFCTGIGLVSTLISGNLGLIPITLNMILGFCTGIGLNCIE